MKIDINNLLGYQVNVDKRDGVYTVFKVNFERRTVLIQKPDDFHGFWINIKHLKYASGGGIGMIMRSCNG